MNRVAEFQAAETRLLRLLSTRLGQRTMIDVGAHHGGALEPFLAAGFDVHAFEPVEANRALLRERVGDPPNLSVRPEAVSRESGRAELHLALREDGSQHDFFHSLEQIGSDKRHRKGESIAVPTVRLDDLVERGEIPGSIGLLKVDTEGHDLAVLEGAAALRSEVVVVEFWGPEHPLGPSPSPAGEMVELMSRRGYAQFIVVEHFRGATSFRYRSLRQTKAESWGNILFFSDRVGKLYEEMVGWCRRGAALAATPLQETLARLFNRRSGLRFYDVGAFRGSFAMEVLQAFPASSGALFEPWEENALELEERLGADPRLDLRREALGAEEGERNFNFLPDAPATGSFLDPLRAAEAPQRRPIAVTTLDRVWAELGEEDVDLIKVDTQGEDLKVLEGGQGTLAAQRPVLMVEVIFVPLYRDQPTAQDLLGFAAETGYRPTRILNVHHTRAGELAFADLLLVHESVPQEESGPPFVAWDPDNAALLQEQLRAANEELRARRQTVQRLRSQRQSLQATLDETNEALARLQNKERGER